MSKIPASTFIQFGTTVNPASEVGIFGSYPSPMFTGNISAMMSGTQWARGWFSSVLNTQRQFIQDQNAVDIVFSNYIAYIQQMGIGEYVSTTVYDLNSIVQIAGQLYLSLATNNQGNAPASSPSSWQSGIPGTEVSGVVKTYAGVVAPSGYLLCNGAAISRTTYAALFNVCGTQYGVGDGITTFNIPDLRGKIPVGFLTGDANFGTVGQTGGEENHTLTVNEMPSHNHNICQGSITAGSGGGNALEFPIGNTYYSGSTGGDAAHNNLQPYLTMNWIIKT